MRQSEGSGRSRTGRIRRDKSAADSPAESLGGKRIIGLGRGHGPLHDTDMVAIHEAALAVLAKTGLGDASPIVVDLVVAAGGTFFCAWPVIVSTGFGDGCACRFAAGYHAIWARRC